MREGEPAIENPFRSRVDEAKKAILTPKESSELLVLASDEPPQHEVYVSRFSEGSVRFTLTGVPHTHDPESPVFNRLRQLLDSEQPDLVMVEGWQHLARDLEKLSTMSDEEIIRQHGEAGFLVREALTRGSDVNSPEPSFEEELRSLEEGEFNRGHVVAYYVFRDVTEWQRRPPESRGELRTYIESLLQRIQRKTRWDDFDFSYEHLEKISKELWGKSIDPTEDYTSLTQPIPHPEETPELNTEVTAISAAVNQQRENYILEQVALVLPTHQSVFLAYGSSHHHALRPAFQTLFRK